MGREAYRKGSFHTTMAGTGGKYEGFEFGTGSVSVNDTLLLIEPEAVKEYAIALRKLIVVEPPEAGGGSTGSTGVGGGSVAVVKDGDKPEKTGGATVTAVKAKSFLGSADVPPATAKMKLVQIAEEVILPDRHSTSARITTSN